MRKKVIIGVSGASGAIYAKVLMDKIADLGDQVSAVGVVMSDNAKDVWSYELGNRSYSGYAFDFYDRSDFMAPFASGSAGYDTMFICPCSMGTLGRIAAGVSDGLIGRAADVILKERRRLILVVRETPYGLLHINNMKTVTEAGAIVCPASPSFYSRPKDFEALVATVVDRTLELAGFDIRSYRWGQESDDPAC